VEVPEFCFANNIILCRLPSDPSHKLQPCDVAVFAPLKAACREQAERLGRGGVKTMGKELLTSLCSPAREKAFASKNVTAGFAASDLFPFNPDSVLRSMPKPLADLTIPKADEVDVEACQRNEVPPTPVTPVSAEGPVSLQNMIIEQDASALDETNKRNLQKYLHKSTKAAQLLSQRGPYNRITSSFCGRSTTKLRCGGRRIR
jgi:hypothetical protein